MPVHVPLRLFSFFLLLAVLAGVLVPHSAAAQDTAVTLTWDTNPEPFVSGYVVYVRPAVSPTEMLFDVGPVTTFRFTGAKSGVGYYFTVVAYTAGGSQSPPSNAVFFMHGTSSSSGNGSLGLNQTPPSKDVVPLAALMTGDPAPVAVAAPANQSQCVASIRSDCYVSSVLAVASAPITSVAALGGERVAFVEGDRRVRIADGSTVSETMALELDSPGTQILDVVAHPDFSANRLVYLSTVEQSPDGARGLSITRFRELGDRLGEPARLITGLPVPPEGPVPFTVDSRGRIYVGLPSRVLRFASDGTVPADNAGASPDFLIGARRPWALQWNSAANEVWEAGEDSRLGARLARFEAHPGAIASMVMQLSESPDHLLSLALQFSNVVVAGVLVDATSGAMFELRGDHANTLLEPFVLVPSFSPRLATFSASGALIVVVDEAAPSAGSTLLRLARRP